jgi:hypothetical protein
VLKDAPNGGADKRRLHDEGSSKESCAQAEAAWSGDSPRLEAGAASAMRCAHCAARCSGRQRPAWGQRRPLQPVRRVFGAPESCARNVVHRSRAARRAGRAETPRADGTRSAPRRAVSAAEPRLTPSSVDHAHLAARALAHEVVELEVAVAEPVREQAAAVGAERTRGAGESPRRPAGPASSSASSERGPSRVRTGVHRPRCSRSASGVRSPRPSRNSSQ